MSLPILRPDSLRTTPSGFALALCLPWIRSLPLAALEALEVSIDGRAVESLSLDLPGRRVAADAVGDESGWWFLQDRVTVVGERILSPGEHEVSVSFRLVVPYLQVGPDGPLVLPFHGTATLALDEASAADRAAVAARVRIPVSEPAARDGALLPPGWILAASAFNWTPEVIRAERAAPDIAVHIVTSGVAQRIEIEPGQLWRSFPVPGDGEVDALRERLTAAGGTVSIVGGSIDDWASPTRRRTDAERLAFLLPQLRAAHRVGAQGLRLPIGQAGESLMRQLLPYLHDLDLVLYEEIQGQQTPASPAAAPAIDVIAGLDDDRVRLLVDISMLMPSLPPSYLALLRAGGVPDALVSRLTTQWRDPATNDAVIDLLRSGGVPPAVHTSYMNLLVRFGRSDAADLRDVLPLVGAFHLKFWDLDDEGGRVSLPIRDLGAELAGTGFGGTFCSEWGGHEWLDDDPATMTAGHLALARTALSHHAAGSIR